MEQNQGDVWLTKILWLAVRVTVPKFCFQFSKYCFSCSFVFACMHVRHILYFAIKRIKENERNAHLSVLKKMLHISPTAFLTDSFWN